MTTREIKKLAEQSFTNWNLDVKKIRRAMSLLNRKQLKTYIKFLKKLENERLVYVFTPMDKVSDKASNKIGSMFPGKKIEYVKDPNLIVGIKIVDNDMVYEFNLKDSLDNIITYLKQSYD